jgi:hypothetical protein
MMNDELAWGWWERLETALQVEKERLDELYSKTCSRPPSRQPPAYDVFDGFGLLPLHGLVDGYLRDLGAI